MVRELYRRHGVWALVLGRFVAGVAPFVAPGAGWAGMAYRRFLPANALANLLWGPVMVGVGYLFGAQAARLEGPWRWAALAVTAGLLGLAFLRLRAIGRDVTRPWAASGLVEAAVGEGASAARFVERTMTNGPIGDPRPRRGAAPAWIRDGLAVYSLGGGPPLLVMPNPQGMVRVPEAHGPLAERLVGLGRRVITFDPPGAFASPRPPRLGLAEMLACAKEALAVAGVAPPVDVVGHSQATLCQLALALAEPKVVRSLILVGAVDGGWPTTRRAGGMPWCWPLTDRRLWRFAVLAAPLAVGRSDVRRLKRLQRLYLDASFVDRRLVPMVRIEPGDRRRPPPRRARWQASVRRVDLRSQLGQITVSTLVCVGRHDPQTPWPANADIAAALPAGRLEVFERSGHYPFVEEPGRFTTVVATFLSSVSQRQVP
jgi:pimeloyl-ACP methyl ester carboxylesterase